MKKIILPNPSEFEKKKQILKQEGKEKLHIVSDFDRTLTKAFVNGKKFRAIITQLYEEHYLSLDYSKKAQELHDKYYPIEVDPNIPLKEKKKAMEEWWRTHKLLLIESGLNLKHIKKVVNEGKLQFREGSLEFFDLTKEKQIPLVIFSSSGLGEAIPLYFDKIKKKYKNIHIISNSLNYDKKGNAVSIREPIIHVFNKGEIALKGLPIREELKEKKNVILLGDSLGDLQMIEGFKYDNIIKIGFFNYRDEERLKDYENKFDVIILNDGSMEFINNLIKEIIG